MNWTPNDYRCHGIGCDRTGECDRHQQLVREVMAADGYSPYPYPLSPKLCQRNGKDFFDFFVAVGK